MLKQASSVRKFRAGIQEPYLVTRRIAGRKMSISRHACMCGVYVVCTASLAQMILLQYSFVLFLQPREQRDTAFRDLGDRSRCGFLFSFSNDSDASLD